MNSALGPESAQGAQLLLEEGIPEDVQDMAHGARFMSWHGGNVGILRKLPCFLRFERDTKRKTAVGLCVFLRAPPFSVVLQGNVFVCF